MKKIDYIIQYDILDRKINQLLEEIEILRSIATRVTPNITGMPSGGDGENPRELAICRMLDLEILANKLIDRLVELKQKIDNS